MDRKEELKTLILALSKKIYKESKRAHSYVKDYYVSTKNLIEKHKTFTKLRQDLDDVIKEYESIDK